MKSVFSWICPFCNQMATITSQNTSENSHTFNNASKDGTVSLESSVIVCPNPKCREYVIAARLFRHNFEQNAFGNGQLKDYTRLEDWQLRPRSNAKPFPGYVPKAILADYKEACLIVNDSPKASATLSRRCLQGIIRDFWKISKPRLIDEIRELEGKIDSTTWQAIDGVRKVGNIGAHMEKDINLIVDVDPDEATMLIGLIEFLLKEWYIARHDREEHMKRVIGLAAKKDQDKETKPPPTRL